MRKKYILQGITFVQGLKMLAKEEKREGDEEEKDKYEKSDERERGM